MESPVRGVFVDANDTLAEIFERQGNRNPLIDHPDWASRVAFSA